MKQKWLLTTGTALALAAALAGCGNTPAADQPQSSQPASLISMEQAQTAALDAADIDAADAEVSSATLDEVAGVTCYKVAFTAGDYSYSYSINAETGEVLEMSSREQTVTTIAPEGGAQTDAPATTSPNTGTAQTKPSSTKPTQTAPSTNTSTGAVTEAKAQEIALAHAGVKAADATITKSKLDYDDGRQVYEIEWYANGAKYDYEIAVATGEIVNSGYEAKTVVAPETASPSARRRRSRPPLPACPAQRKRTSTNGNWTTTMAARSMKARSSTAAPSMNSPSMPLPAMSPNGKLRP